MMKERIRDKAKNICPAICDDTYLCVSIFVTLRENANLPIFHI